MTIQRLWLLVWPVPPLALLLGVLAFVGSFASSRASSQVVLMLVLVTVVVGLYSFVGLTGVLSFGHTIFMAIGAYTAAILTIPAQQKAFLFPLLPAGLTSIQVNVLVSALIGGTLAAIVALFIAPVISRMAGIAASLALFAGLLAVNVVATNWQAVTRGQLGIYGLPLSTTSIVAWSVAVLTMCSALVFQKSRIGLRCRGAREDEVAARGLGAPIARDRALALVFSAFWVGVGGALYANYLGSFAPADLYLDITFITVAMLVIGGTTSMSGAVLGVVVVGIVQLVLREVQDGVTVGPLVVPARPGLSQVGLGILMLLIVIFRPDGITRGREISPRVVRRRGRDRTPEAKVVSRS